MNRLATCLARLEEQRKPQQREEDQVDLETRGARATHRRETIMIYGEALLSWFHLRESSSLPWKLENYVKIIFAMMELYGSRYASIVRLSEDFLKFPP